MLQYAWVFVLNTNNRGKDEKYATVVMIDREAEKAKKLALEKGA